MSEELKPCPTCGAMRGLYVLYDEHDMEWFVFCDNCKTSVCNENNMTREDAVETWNRRAGDAKKCISCDYCDVEEGMCYRDPNHTGMGMLTLLDASCPWWKERR